MVSFFYFYTFKQKTLKQYGMASRHEKKHTQIRLDSLEEIIPLWHIEVTKPN